MILYILIALCFLCVYVRLYMWKPTQPYWSRLSFAESIDDCQTNDDCPFTNQICFHDNKCHATMVQTCDDKTGQWVMGADGVLKCVCRYPDRMTQAEDGSNCVVDIACGLYGHLKNGDPQLNQCVCDDPENFKLEPKTGHCVRKTEIDRLRQTSCPRGTVLSSSSGLPFHPKYLNQFAHSAKCLRKPCSFNVLNGKPLKQAFWAPWNGGYSCVCDSRYGNFGVRLDTPYYLTTATPGGYNACGSIFEDEPDVPLPNERFKIYCYFYLPKKKPICFLMFTSLNAQDLVPLFKGQSVVTISETFGEGLDQYVFKAKKALIHTVTTCETTHWWGYFNPHHKMTCRSEDERLYKIPDCADTPRAPYSFELAAFQNNVYARHFLCKNLKGFDQKVVVNPYCVDVKDAHTYSHGYEFYMRNGYFRIKPAPAPKPDYFPLDQPSKDLLGAAWTFVPGHVHYDAFGFM